MAFTMSRYGEKEKAIKVKVDEVVPTDSQGQPFNEIPFIFVGAHANEPMVEYPQLADIANLNLTHYRLSADEKQALHLLQPTLAVSGLNDNWIKNHFANGLSLGSSAYIPLPEGASASLVEPKEITAIGEAIRETENQMQRLGAKLVEESEGTKTATEVNSDEAARTSVLASNCNNVSAAYNRAFGICGSVCWESITKTRNTQTGQPYQINTDFAVIGMTPEEQQALVNSWISGAISYTEMRKKFKEAGIAYQDDEEVKEAHEEKQENDFAKATASGFRLSNSLAYRGDLLWLDKASAAPSGSGIYAELPRLKPLAKWFLIQLSFQPRNQLEWLEQMERLLLVCAKR